MSTVQEIESAISGLSVAEMRQVHDWLENTLEDQLAFTEAFAAKIALSENEMQAGQRPRVRQP